MIHLSSLAGAWRYCYCRDSNCVQSPAPEVCELQSKLPKRGDIGDYAGDYYRACYGDTRV